MPSTNPQQISLVLLALLTAVFVAGINPALVDDSFISFAYARNLHEIGVLTWHPNLPRVDGFTSLGHVLLLAFGLVSGLNLIAVNSLLMMAALFVTLTIANRQMSGASLLARIAGCALIALNSGVAVWFSAGLDALLFMACFIWAYVAGERALRQGRFDFRAFVAFSALALMRPEGMIVTMSFGLFFVVYQSARRCLYRPSVGWVLAAIGVVGGLLAWRYLSYGHPLPNTYYAKSGQFSSELESGLVYLLGWIEKAGAVVVAFPVLALALGVGNIWRVLFVLGLVALVVVAGGDPHPGYRFFLPILPLAAIDVARVIDLSGSRKPVIAAVFLASYASVNLGHIGGMTSGGGGADGVRRIVYGDFPSSRTSQDPVAWRRARAAGKLGEVLDGAPLAATDVGVLAFASRLPVIDMLGLNDREFAHLPKPAGQRNNWGITRIGEVVENRVPYIYLGFPEISGWNWATKRGEDLYCAPELVLHRVHVSQAGDEMETDYLCVSIGVGSDSWLNFFTRTDVVPDLRKAGRVVARQCIPELIHPCGRLGGDT